MRGRDISTVGGKRQRAKTWVFGAGLVVLLLAGGGAATAYVIGGDSDQKPPKPHIDYATAEIEQGRLSGTTPVQGTLSFASSRALAAGLSGTVTGLPIAGTQIGLGQQLYALDDRSIFLLHGTLPAWRGFSEGMANGADVKQLEENLKTLGFFSREPDEAFTWATQDAIERWQKETGQERTGSLEFGRVEFSPHDVRIGEVKASVGDHVGPGSAMLVVTSPDKQVEVNLKLADQSLGVVGAPVSIDLPGGNSTSGTVSSVSAPTEKGSSEKKEVVIPVTVILGDPAAAGELQRASVTVNFPSETRENVLSVPVEALLALSDKQFGVEVVTEDGGTERVPVKTGLFAAGRVEVLGDEIDKGQKVVVPKR